jgi:ATP adenylyltransferase
MDYLWTPWRFQYMAESAQEVQPDCIFCHALRLNDDRKALIVHRGKNAFVILNRFPYTSGHVMIVPYLHVAELNACEAGTLDEIMELARKVESVYYERYKPHGVNLGMNLGRAAGAGVAGHLHLHMLPRWFGDSNFMTVTGETRMLPEELSATYERMKGAWNP